MALLFLVTASALTIAVIYTAVSENKKSNSDQEKPKTAQITLAGTQLKDYTPVASVPELQKIDTKVGTGKEAKAGDKVTVDYTGAIASTGVIFQSSLDTGQPVSFGLDQVIKGWTEGVPGMKEGGTRRLMIPAVMAYGANPPQGSGIPANADLVFDITLHKID
jgi:FKBP-type peptidyl-prolyl cis-trans isomerase